jgi:hypothetical protein
MAETKAYSAQQNAEYIAKKEAHPDDPREWSFVLSDGWNKGLGAEYTTVHELAHAVHFELKKGGVQWSESRLNDLYSKYTSQALVPGKQYTEYSKFNPTEMLAESLTSYVITEKAQSTALEECAMMFLEACR